MQCISICVIMYHIGRPVAFRASPGFEVLWAELSFRRYHSVQSARKPAKYANMSHV